MPLTNRCRASASPARHYSCQSFESIPSKTSRSSASVQSQSRDSSADSRLSASSSISSTISAPSWKTNKTSLYPQATSQRYYNYDLPCEFEFLGCNLRFHPDYIEAWISHTASHFVGTIPPACAVCTVCDGKSFEDYEDPISNWRNRMIHIGDHFAEGSCNSVQPDFWVIEHMFKNDLLSADQYSWAMQHARKPGFRDLIYITVQEANSQRYQQEKDLEKENRLRRRAKQKGKRSSKLNHSTQLVRYEIKPVQIIGQCGSTVSSPCSNIAMQHDHQPDDKLVFDQRSEIERSMLQDGYGSVTIDLEKQMSQDDMTISSSSSSESEEADINDEVDCFIPPPHSKAVLTTVEENHSTHTSMTSSQVARANQLVEELLLKLKMDWGKVCHRGHAPSSSSGNTSRSSIGTRPEAPREQRGTKRLRKSGQGEGRDDNDEEQDRNSQAASNTTSSAEVDLFFACPYRKRNPRKFCVRDWGPCALTGHPSISRVKNHLYRYHLIINCERCEELFESEEELKVHTKRAEACIATASSPADGITIKMKEQLRTKKKAFPGQTPAQIWEQVYRLLFPGIEVPDPYFEPVRDHQESEDHSQEYDDLIQFQGHIHRELPRFFEQVVQNAVLTNALVVEENTRAQMLSLLPEAIRLATSAFRHTLHHVDPGRARTDAPLDLSTLQITQLHAPQGGRSPLSSDSGYRSNRPALSPFSTDTRRESNQFSDVGQRPQPLDAGTTSDTGERIPSGFQNFPGRSQAADGDTQATESFLQPSNDIDELPDIVEFMDDPLSFPPGPWPTDPAYMSLDLDDDLYSGL